MAVANSGSHTVTVFRSLGNGSFDGGTSYASGGVTPRALRIADLNRDGNLDLVVVNLHSAAVAVLLQDPPAGFAAARTFAAGGAWPAAVAVADFNSDGWPDVAAAHLDNNVIDVLVGDRAGGLRQNIPLDESASLLLWNVSFHDPGADTWTGTVDYGDGSGIQPLALAGDRTFQLNHIYASSGHYVVTVRVTDDDGGVGTHTLAVTVGNVAPTIAALTDVVVDEGATFRQTVAFADPGADRWTARIDYGDGSPVRTLAPGTARSVSLNHAYADPGNYVVSITVLDDDGGTAHATLAVTRPRSSRIRWFEPGIPKTSAPGGVFRPAPIWLGRATALPPSPWPRIRWAAAIRQPTRTTEPMGTDPVGSERRRPVG